VRLIVRTVIYASLFMATVLVFLPAGLLRALGVTRPDRVGLPQVFGLAGVVVGAILALWCIAVFVRQGRGTPAPFDPPCRLVVSGPYGFVRNPMYVGAGCAVAGAALYFHSAALLAYLCVLGIAAHLFVVLHEEPALTRTFGDEYRAYVRRVGRWLPRR